MISEKKYYDFLYENFLVKNKEQWEKANLWCENHTFCKMDEETEKLLELLNGIEKKYEFNLQRMCRNNFELLSLYQIEFLGQIKKRQRSIGLKFLIVCCLADKILDSKRFCTEEQQKIINLLTMERRRQEASFFELGELLEEIDHYIEEYENTELKEKILKLISDAFTSEQYMWRHLLLEKEDFNQKVIGLLTDKSVKFEKAVLLLSLKEEMSKAAIEAADLIGKISWLTDDLCDFISDIREQRKNSLLYFEMPDEEMDLEYRAEMALEHMSNHIRRLEDYLKKLEIIAPGDLYFYIINMVKRWFADIEQSGDMSR